MGKLREVRAASRDLTLQALQAREASLKQINAVVRNVTEGVNLGIADEERNIEKVLSDAFAGMDEATQRKAGRKFAREIGMFIRESDKSLH